MSPIWLTKPNKYVYLLSQDQQQSSDQAFYIQTVQPNIISPPPRWETSWTFTVIIRCLYFRSADGIRDLMRPDRLLYPLTLTKGVSSLVVRVYSVGVAIWNYKSPSKVTVYSAKCLDATRRSELNFYSRIQPQRKKMKAKRSKIQQTQDLMVSH